MQKPTAEDVRQVNMFTLASAHALYVEAIRRIAGESGLQEIAEANRIHGLHLGTDGIQNGTLRKGDLSSIYDFFEQAHPYFGFDLEKILDTPDEMEIKVTHCPWLEGFRSLSAKEDICHWVTKIDEGIGQAVDPSTRLLLTRCMMRGDKYCIYRFEKSKE